MKAPLISAVVAICFIAECDSKRDVETLQGKWQLTRMVGDFSFDLPSGKKTDGPEILIFTGDTFTFKNDGRHKTGTTGSFSCDETKSPNEIIFNFNGRKVIGIYKFSLAGLSICIGEDDQVAPSQFRGGPGARPALLVFERAKTE